MAALEAALSNAQLLVVDERGNIFFVRLACRGLSMGQVSCDPSCFPWLGRTSTPSWTIRLVTSAIERMIAEDTSLYTADLFRSGSDQNADRLGCLALQGPSASRSHSMQSLRAIVPSESQFRRRSRLPQPPSRETLPIYCLRRNLCNFRRLQRATLRIGPVYRFGHMMARQQSAGAWVAGSSFPFCSGASGTELSTKVTRPSDLYMHGLASDSCTGPTRSRIIIWSARAVEQPANRTKSCLFDTVSRDSMSLPLDYHRNLHKPRTIDSAYRRTQ